LFGCVKGEFLINKDKTIISICVITVVIGIFIIAQPYLASKKEIAYENVAIEIYDADVLNKLDNVNEPVEDEEDSSSSTDNKKDESDLPNGDNENGNKEEQTNEKNNYIGTLEIKKIGLKKGFVAPDSKYNDISYNVTIINGFDYPDVKKGNFILAAHSGTGPQSFFKNLYKLSTGDEAIITYKGKKYTYKIVKIYTQKKQGFLTIYRNVEKTTLTLITCTKDNKKLQTVYIAELI